MRPDELIPLVAILIPIVLIVFSVMIGMFAIFFRYRRRQQMFHLHHAERMAAIDKGLELPPIPEQFFYDAGSPPSPHRTLLKGLILTLGGLAVLGSLYAYHPEFALYGFIPVGVGAAFLIYYFAVGRRQAREVEAKRQMEVEAARPAAAVH